VWGVGGGVGGGGGGGGVASTQSWAANHRDGGSTGALAGLVRLESRSWHAAHTPPLPTRTRARAHTHTHVHAHALEVIVCAFDARAHAHTHKQTHTIGVVRRGEVCICINTYGVPGGPLPSLGVRRQRGEREGGRGDGREIVRRKDASSFKTFYKEHIL